MPHSETASSNYQYIVLEIDNDTCPASRNTLLSHLHQKNILARRYFYPGCHRMEPYKTLYPASGESLPKTEALAERVLVLPTGFTVNTDDVEYICDIITEYLANI